MIRESEDLPEDIINGGLDLRLALAWNEVPVDHVQWDNPGSIFILIRDFFVWLEGQASPVLEWERPPGREADSGAAPDFSPLALGHSRSGDRSHRGTLPILE